MLPTIQQPTRSPNRWLSLGFFVGTLLLQVFHCTGELSRMRRIVNHEDDTTGKTSPAISLANCNYLVNLTNASVAPTITSPNYPFVYSPSTICRWVIRSEFGNRIQIIFDSFTMQPSQYPWGCSTDYLEITDIHRTQRFCGSKIPFDGRYLSLGPQLILRFVSDIAWQYQGFSLRVYDHTTTCGGISNASSGRIISPNYPRAYPNNVFCAWKIQGPKGSRVKLNCSGRFRLEKSRRCEADSLVLSITGDDTMMNSTRYCSNVNPGVIFSSGNKMNAIFYTNSLRNNLGFSCHYEIIHLQGNSNTIDFKPSIDERSCECGRVNRRVKRIVGGELTESFPWLVAIAAKVGRQLLCGGVLVSPRYVLTAAHCLRGIKASDLVVVLENYDSRRPHVNQHLPVEDFIPHEKMKDRYDYDVAILKIPLAYEGLDERSCICLPSSNFSIINKTAEVYGWGRNFKKSDDRLYKVIVPILDDTQCKKAFAKLIEITPRMFCAGEAGKDACDGDSGGPLVVEDDGKQTVVGIVSFGFGCGVPGYPGVYAKVTELLTWIRQKAHVMCP